MKAMLFYPNRKEIPEINTIKITKEAFQKMNLYASIVSDIIGGDNECLGTLLNYKDRNDNTARDIHLWKGQKVDSGRGWPGNPMDDYEEAKSRGMKILGLWHSHGSNAVYHSDFDEEYLKNMYRHIKNKIVINEKNRSIECIVDGETIKLFEEGSNKEIRIKGKIEDLKYIERDECRVLNSIVINRNSYSGGYNNPKLNHDYDAEVWAGYEKNDYKRSQNVQLELLEESNNIQLNEEDLVKEVGEKVKYRDTYLKDLPKYKEILEKYRNVKDVKNQNKPIEQIIDDEKKPEDPDKNVKPAEQAINDEKKQEDTNLQTIAQEQKEGNEKKSENTNLQTIVQEQVPVKQGIEHDQILHRTKTYMERLEEFYNTLSRYDTSVDKALADLCLTYSGRLYWLWNERFERSKEIIKKLKKKYLTPEQKKTLESIRIIIESNKYLKRNHSLVYQDLQRRLDVNNSNFYCNIAHYKDRLLNNLKSKKGSYNTLEEKVQNTNSPTTSLNNPGQPKKTFGSYLKNIAKYVGIAALATAMVLLPAKYCSKNHYNKPAVVYTVKKGDNLWNLSKDYLKKNGIKTDDKTVYKAVDKVAEENGKGKQAEYKIGGKEKENPHLIKPGEKIVFSKKVLDHVKHGGKK